MTKNVGGPAFPTPDFWESQQTGVTEGMSLRDYFAAHAPAMPDGWASYWASDY